MGRPEGDPGYLVTRRWAVTRLSLTALGILTGMSASNASHTTRQPESTISLPFPLDKLLCTPDSGTIRQFSTAGSSALLTDLLAGRPAAWDIVRSSLAIPNVQGTLQLGTGVGYFENPENPAQTAAARAAALPIAKSLYDATKRLLGIPDLEPSRIPVDTFPVPDLNAQGGFSIIISENVQHPC